MNFRKLVVAFCLVLGTLLIFPSSISGQSFDFKTYDSSVGLPQNFVYSLAQGNDGFIWIGTGEGLVKYNGVDFQNIAVSDTLSEDFIKTIHISKKGEVWVGHNNGGISIISDSVSNLSFNNISNNPVTSISESVDGNTWIALQNSGLLKISTTKKVIDLSSSRFLQGITLTGIEAVDNDKILVGTNGGLYNFLIKSDTIASIQQITTLPETKINKIIPRKTASDEYWITTEDEGFYLYNSTTNIAKQVSDQKLCLLFNVQNENIQTLVEEKNGDLLLATWGDGVIKLFYDKVSKSYVKSLNFSTANGLNNNYVKDILCDKEGNYWFGTYGGGISALTDGSFIFYSLQDIGFKQEKVLSVYESNDVLWMGLENGLLKTDPYCFFNHEFYDASLGVPNDKVVGFTEDKHGNIWVGTNNNGVYYRKPNEIRFHEYIYCKNTLGRQINDLKMKGDTLLLATTAGLFVIDSERKIVTEYNTNNGLPHNSINFVYVDREGHIWIGPKNCGITKIDNSGTIENHKIIYSPLNVSDMVEDANGVKWLATIGKGVIRYADDGIYEVTTKEGLGKNYCYSISCDKNNKLWVSHWPGISSIDIETMQIRNYRGERKMSGDFYKIWKDKDGHIWFASSDGVVKYYPELDVKNIIAPQLNFSSIKISGKTYPITEEINLPYPYSKSKYQFRFDFIGISYKNPKGVTYQYQLIKNDEFETAQWIDLGNTNYREFDFLPDGQYELRISAANADGVRTPNPLILKMNIESPFWKKLWFYTIILALLAYVVYSIIKLREQKLREQKKLLETEVANQTILLRHQNFEIERKNQDITDSINYAKRIQSSILPPIGNLFEWFSDSFIFFAPRDIVSGDFYWFNHRDGKFIICCVDCTGHGVPGAFMSMIGSTLLTDIFKRREIDDPGKLLQKLDEELKILLHQGGEAQSTDGMDISIIEIDLTTKKIRVAAARRPVYLILNNEFVAFNGTRRSVGEYLPKDKENAFVSTEYSCKMGDQIYLFSDGYTDQFGGPLGKKFMTVGLKNLIQEISTLPMPDQLKIVQNNFYEWKGDLDQVDDVIVMGIKF